MADPSNAPATSPEQRHFATVLEWITHGGLALLVLTFIIYVSGWWPAHLAPAQLVQLWGRPLREYLALSGSPTGWHWLPLVRLSDHANLLGIALLAGASLAGMLALLPVYWRRRDGWMLAICAANLLLLALAASGALVLR